MLHSYTLGGFVLSVFFDSPLLNPGDLTKLFVVVLVLVQSRSAQKWLNLKQI